MKRLHRQSPQRAAHFEGLKGVRKTLAARGVTVHTHRTDPDGGTWELFVGRRGQTLKVRWDGATTTLALEPTGGEPSSASVDEDALFEQVVERVTTFYGLTSS